MLLRIVIACSAAAFITGAAQASDLAIQCQHLEDIGQTQEAGMCWHEVQSELHLRGEQEQRLNALRSRPYEPMPFSPNVPAVSAPRMPAQSPLDNPDLDFYHPNSPPPQQCIGEIPISPPQGESPCTRQ